MKNMLPKIALFGPKVNRQHAQMLGAIVALAMLVLGVGAPADGGGYFNDSAGPSGTAANDGDAGPEPSIVFLWSGV